MCRRTFRFNIHMKISLTAPPTHAMHCRKFLLLLKFLLISQEPQELQGSFLRGLLSSGPAASTGRPAWAVPCLTPPPWAPSEGRLGVGGWLTPIPCVCGSSGSWVRRGASSRPSMVPRPALCYQFAPCRDTSEMLHCLSGCIPAAPGTRTWSHSYESADYECSAPAAHLEPQGCPKVSSYRFWKALGSPSGSIQPPNWSLPHSLTGPLAVPQAHRCVPASGPLHLPIPLLGCSSPGCVLLPYLKFHLPPTFHVPFPLCFFSRHHHLTHRIVYFSLVYHYLLH